MIRVLPSATAKGAPTAENPQGMFPIIQEDGMGTLSHAEASTTSRPSTAKKYR